MITENKKKEIVAAVNREKKALGSMNNVAKKLGISHATISANVLKAENWHNVSESLWADIAASLSISIVSREWNVVATHNYKIMHNTMKTAQKEGLFMAISEKAGSGKTAAVNDFVKKSPDHSVFSLQCEEWSKRNFLHFLAIQLGVTTDKYEGSDRLIDGIVKFFKQRSSDVMPLLVLDEADKLKPAALRFLIVLYNRLEDQIGLVICGTDNLEKKIKKGVRMSEMGFDEIDSRLGRNFIHLMGYTKNDVALICQANGISDPETIDSIFADSDPQHKMVNGKYLNLIEDMRAVKRKIKKELLNLKKVA